MLAEVPSVDCNVGDLAFFRDGAPSIAEQFENAVVGQSTIYEGTSSVESHAVAETVEEGNPSRYHMSSSSFLVQEAAPLTAHSASFAGGAAFFKKVASCPSRLRVCAELPSGSALHAARVAVREAVQVSGGDVPDPDTGRLQLGGAAGHPSRLAAEFADVRHGGAGRITSNNTPPHLFQPSSEDFLPSSGNSSSRDETPVALRRRESHDVVAALDLVGHRSSSGSSSRFAAAVPIGPSSLDALLGEGVSTGERVEACRRCLDQETRRRRNLILRELDERHRIRGAEREALHRAEAERYRQEQLRVEVNFETVTDVYISPEAKRTQRQRREMHSAHCAAWKQTYRSDIRASTRAKQARVEAVYVPQECARMLQEDRYGAVAESTRAAAAQLMRTFWETSLEIRVSTAKSFDKLLSTSNLRRMRMAATAEAQSHGNEDDVADDVDDDSSLVPPEGSELHILRSAGAAEWSNGRGAPSASRPASAVPPPPSSGCASARQPLGSSSRPNSGSSTMGTGNRRVHGSGGGAAPIASRPLSAALSHASRADRDPLDVLERDVASSVASVVSPQHERLPPRVPLLAAVGTTNPLRAAPSPAPSSCRSTAMSARLRQDSLFESFLFGCMAMYEVLDKDIRDLQSSADAVLASFRVQLDSLTFQESQIRDGIVPAEALAFRFLKRDELVSRDQAKMQERINVKNRRKIESQEASRRLALIDEEYFDVLLHDVVGGFAESERRSTVVSAEEVAWKTLVAQGDCSKERVLSIESFHAEQYRLWKSEGQKRVSLEWNEADARNDLYKRHSRIH